MKSESSARKAGPAHRRTGRDLRQEFIDAALRMLEGLEGPDSLDARSVAIEAGKPGKPRSLGSLAFHFKAGGFHELKGAVAEEGLRRLLAAVEMEQSRAGRKPIEGLQAMASAYVLFAVENPRLYRLIASEYWTDGAASLRTKVLLELREQVMLCQVTGELRLGEPEPLTHVVVILVYGMTQAALDGLIPAPIAPDAIVDALKQLVKGIGAVPDH